jgi:hypothetical protein
MEVTGNGHGSPDRAAFEEGELSWEDIRRGAERSASADECFLSLVRNVISCITQMINGSLLV